MNAKSTPVIFVPDARHRMMPREPFQVTLLHNTRNYARDMDISDCISIIKLNNYGKVKHKRISGISFLPSDFD